VIFTDFRCDFTSLKRLCNVGCRTQLMRQSAIMPEKMRTSREYRLRRLAAQHGRARRIEQEALLIVRNFNARLSTDRFAGFWPTIATAHNAQHPWLVVLCESCETVLDVDLRVKPRHPEAPICAVLPEVRCPRCNGHGRPRIVGLAKHASR
jgi:hypothetical protein